MQFLLLGLLITEALIIFFFNGKNILSPSFIACVVCVFSISVFTVSGEYYGYELHLNTVLVVVGLIFALFVGEILVNATAKRSLPICLKETGKPIVLPVYVCIILEAFVAVVGVLYFTSVYKFSLKVGNTPGNYFGMARYVRTSEEAYQSGIFISQGNCLSECIFYFMVFYLFYNKALTGKFLWRYVWIFPAYALHIFSSDNRTRLLQLIAISLIIVFFILKQKSGWSRKHDKKIIFCGILGIVVYLVLFRLLGYRTNFAGQKDLWGNIVKYTSSGVVGLDKYLNGEIVSTDKIFAERILKSIYESLRSWGFAIPELSNHEQFFYFAQSGSNIYTGFKSFIQSFGIVGATFIIMGLGMLISYMINSLKYKKFTFIKLIMLGLFLYPVIMLPIDGVMPSVLNVTTLYRLFYIMIIIYFANIVRDKKYDDRLSWGDK